mmetsp:Transcript_53533/g.109596  ORF Transcript_53533/g.109596 Transcript_53533/m.109596 type:complete len:105 (-) Transcript_53533:1050-1364(-)
MNASAAYAGLKPCGVLESDPMLRVRPLGGLGMRSEEPALRQRAMRSRSSSGGPAVDLDVRAGVLGTAPQTPAARAEPGGNHAEPGRDGAPAAAPQGPPEKGVMS